MSTANLPQRHLLPPTLFALAIVSLIVVGWQRKEDVVISAETGVGYMLGIIGASLMVLLLLYPLRKRWRLMRRLPATKHWFRVHMMLGMLGATAILFHCNFQVGALNSAVALYCMLLVVLSGIIGRYFYSKLHMGLYGQKLSSAALLDMAHQQKQLLTNQFNHYPAVLEKLDSLYAKLIPSNPLKISLSYAVLAAPRRLYLKIRFDVFIRGLLGRGLLGRGLLGRGLLGRGLQEPGLQDAELLALWKSTRQSLNNYLNTLRKLAQLQFFESLFAWWHVLHLPIFIMMLLTMIIHVWAVHVY